MKEAMRLKISVKLFLAFFAVIILSSAIWILGNVNIKKMAMIDRELYENMTVPLAQLGSIGELFKEQGLYIRKMMLEESLEKRQSYKNKVISIREESDGIIEAFDLRILSDEMRVAYQNFITTKDNFREQMDQIIEAMLHDGHHSEQEFEQLKETFEMAELKEEVAIEQLMKMKVEDAFEKYQINQLHEKVAIIWMRIISFLVLCTAIAMGILLNRMIAKPIKSMSHVAKELAGGDLTVSYTLKSRDELGELSCAMMLMRESIHEMLREIVMASEQVTIGSKQISGSSVAVAQGATDQASAIQELTAAITEVSEQTAQNARYAEDANNAAIQAHLFANKGQAEMREMLQAMEAITEASNSISRIIKVIDEIAFQTNMLALNAAVEAARVGEHGRGFAVVAEEIRKLAQRSTKAAKETTELIEEARQKATEGKIMTNNIAQTLEGIVGTAEKTTHLVTSIANAAKEQAQSIQQINQGVEQVADVVSDNSASAQETASASQELHGQSEVLRGLVNKFKL